MLRRSRSGCAGITVGLVNFPSAMDNTTGDLGMDVDLSLDKELSESDDDNLSIVEMTTTRGELRNIPSMDIGDCNSLNADTEDDTLGFRRMSTLASQEADKNHISARKSSSDEEKTPISVSSIFSSIARGLTRPFGENKTKDEENQHIFSPVSVMGNSSTPSNSTVASRKTHRGEKLLFLDEEDVSLKEFEEYLRDDESEGQRIPSLRLVEYGSPSSYSSDMWTLIHNTIRRELIDLFEIVRVMKSKYSELTLGDIKKMKKWWAFFTAIWAEYDKYSTKSLEPIIQQICQIDGRSDILKDKKRHLRDMKEWLDLKLVEISSYIDEFESLPRGRALTLICMNIDSYGHKCVTYFTGIESLYPSFIENYHDDDIKVSTECMLIEGMRKSSLFAEMIVALTRWMTTETEDCSTERLAKRRSRWLNAHLYFLERQSLQNYIERYERNYGSILCHFRKQ